MLRVMYEQHYNNNDETFPTGTQAAVYEILPTTCPSAEMFNLDLRSPSLSGSSGLITARSFYHNSLVRHEDPALVTQRSFNQHGSLPPKCSTIAALISGTLDFAG